MTNIDRATRVLRESLDRIWGYDAPSWAGDIADDLQDAGLLAPDGMTYEYGDNGWDDETNSPAHYPVEPSCRDDDHCCPDPAPPRYRRIVGPWEEA